MSVGHGSGVIDKAWLDQAIADVEKSTTFNHVFNIPLGGGSSKDGKTIYMDASIPASYQQRGGQQVDVTKYLRLHEWTEKRLLDAGMTYLPAHGIATAAEIAAVQDDGLDVNQYDSFWTKQLKVAAKHELGDGTPPNLELAPYQEKT
jgi:hypothetical protein